MFRSRNHDSLDSEFFLPLLAGDVDIKSIYDRDDPLYPSLSACLNRVDKLCSETPKGYHLALKGCYFEFFYILYANSTARDEADRKNRARDLERTKLILSYIDENYKEAISITDIASYCGFSESHFMRFFKNTMGVSFVSYLNDFRLNVAARLLSSNDESILSVAENCGFFNLSYFNRMFKRIRRDSGPVQRNSQLTTERIFPTEKSPLKLRHAYFSYASDLEYEFFI